MMCLIPHHGLPQRQSRMAKWNGVRIRHATLARPNGRAADPVDARNGQSQHSPAKRAHCSPSTRHTTSPHTPRRKKERTRTSRSASQSASTDSEREGRKGSRRQRPDPPGSSDCSTSEDDDDVSDAQSRHASKAKSNGNVERSPHSTRRHMSWHVQTGSGPRGRKGRPESALSGQKVPSLAQHQTHLPILQGERKNVQEPREAHHEVL